MESSGAENTDEAVRAAVHRTWETAMRAGDFEAAWRATDVLERTRRERGSRDESQGDLLWDGSSFEGKLVLVRCLHGLGDTLQLMRFVPQIREIAKEVIFAVQPALIPLLSCDGRFGRVINGWAESWPEHDMEIEVMELAYALRIQERELPGEIPYLDRRAIARKSNWRAPRKETGISVGLIWEASRWDRSRSLPGHLLSALKCPRVSFFSLQQEVSRDVQRALPLEMKPLFAETSDLIDAAAAIVWLDLIITVDAMPAHLAGALGRPVWVMLKRNADWRWMDGRTDSPWYPTMRLFRERVDWQAVVEEVHLALIAFAAQRA